MVDGLRAEAFERVALALGRSRMMESGSVLTNGWSTLRPGDIYVLGLNPGGECKAHAAHTIERHLREHEDKVDGLSHGDNPRFANHVRDLVRAFGQDDAASVFMTNAIFLRTPARSEFGLEADSLLEGCWAVHQWFLSIVRPKIILALGNDRRGLSATRFLAQQAEIDWATTVKYAVPHKPDSFRHGCTFDANLSLGQRGSLSCVVVGAPHPSRFPVTASMSALAQSVIRTANHAKLNAAA